MPTRRRPPSRMIDRAVEASRDKCVGGVVARIAPAHASVMGWFSSKPQQDASEDNITTRLKQVVALHLPNADPAAVRIIAALAGLLAAVGYADRRFTEPELQHVRKILARVEGMSRSGTESIMEVLRTGAAEASDIHMHHFARDLRELTDREFRLDVLDMLLDLAAADDEVTFAETKYLRQVTSSLGLSPDDYNISQDRHRDKLSVLR
jgi:uncharacterized tellurite resistance protein B-like protein